MIRDHIRRTQMYQSSKFWYGRVKALISRNGKCNDGCDCPSNDSEEARREKDKEASDAGRNLSSSS